MRRGLLTLLALLGGGSAAWAQVHFVSAPGAETIVKVSIDEVYLKLKHEVEAARRLREQYA